MTAMHIKKQHLIKAKSILKSKCKDYDVKQLVKLSKELELNARYIKELNAKKRFVLNSFSHIETQEYDKGFYIIIEHNFNSGHWKLLQSNLVDSFYFIIIQPLIDCNLKIDFNINQDKKREITEMLIN